MTALKRAPGLALALALLLIRSSEARQSGPAPSPWEGAPGIQRSVAEIMASPAGAENPRKNPVIRSPRLIPNRGRLTVQPASASALQSSVAAKGQIQPLSPQTVSTSFLAVQDSESGFIPPDSMGAVGPTQILVAVNGRIKVFDKLGNLGSLNATLDAFFGSVLPGGAGTTDPRCRFDRLSQRWFVTCLSSIAPNRFLLAVSSGATITAGSDFTFFFFQQDLVGTTPNTDTGGFADYDTLGIDANALYIGCNIFNAAGTSLIGSTGYVVRKSSVLGAGPIVVTAFRQLAAGSGAGPITPQGVDNDDPAATEGYFIGVDNAVFSLLQLRRVSNPGGSPTISGNLSVSVPTTRFPRDVDALGSTHTLDGGDDRLMMASIRNGTLWTVHQIDVDSTGTATTPALDATSRNGARWYQIGNLSATPSLVQSGTAFDPTSVSSGTGRHFWMPSLAVSGQGHMAVGGSIAAPTNSAGTQIQPSVGVAGRLFTDALGSTRAITIAKAGAGNYNVESTNGQRWGDFSYTSVDPTDNMTMWTVQEYCNATNTWDVQVVRLLAPPPATPVSATPSSVSRGTPSISVAITGTSTSGSGFYDPGSGFTNRLSASVTGGVTVNSVTFTDATHCILDLNVPIGATLGLQNITITNPDGQALVLSNGLNVTAAVPPTVTSVSSTSPNGTYGSGAIIPVTVTFSGTVNVTGTPQLTLESGAADAVLNFISGSGTATLSFGYAVSAGDISADLDYVSTNSLALNGGTIRTPGLVDADLTLPVPGAVGSLGFNKNLVIDTVPPNTTITSTPAALSNTSTAVFVFSSTKPAGAVFETNLDGAGFVSNGTSTTISYPGLSDGAHTFQVRAGDTATPSNVDATPATFAWTVDTVAPNTQITAQPPDPDTNASPTFSYTSTEGSSTFEVRVDGGAWTSTGATGSVVVAPPLGNGLHTFDVRATDAAGNVDASPATYSWTVQGQAVPSPSPGKKHHHCGLLGLEGIAVLGLLSLLRRRR